MKRYDYECPHCTEKIAVLAEQVGQSMICPHCDSAFKVEDPNEPICLDPDTTIGETDPESTKPPEPDGEVEQEIYFISDKWVEGVIIECPECKREVKIHNTQVGKVLPCPACKSPMEFYGIKRQYQPPSASSSIPTPAAPSVVRHNEQEKTPRKIGFGKEMKILLGVAVVGVLFLTNRVGEMGDATGNSFIGLLAGLALFALAIVMVRKLDEKK